MNTYRIFDQQKTGCLLFNHTTFRMRSKKRLENEILNGYGMAVDGLYTKPNEYGKYRGKDVFDGKFATLMINDKFINGIFHEMSNVKTYFYVNGEQEPALVSFMQIIINIDENLSILDPLYDEKSNSQKCYYTFCVNTTLPDLDIVATKIVGAS